MKNHERAQIPILSSIAGVSENRRVWLCDVWGVLHDGLTAFEPALDACLRFRDRGGQIILISNSPRPAPGVMGLLDSLKIPRECFDALVTSGDVTRALVEDHLNEPIFHLGPERDKGFFDGLPVKFVSASQASVVVCTGFFEDEYETPEDYDGVLSEFASRRALMICANPDLVVERGDKLLPCAGALAKRYEALGQTVIQAGKPFRPIYDLALKKVSTPLSPNEVLAIGDGIDTDIKGAFERGFDAIYIASRVFIRDDDERTTLDSKYLDHLFGQRPFRPLGAMAHLNW